MDGADEFRRVPAMRAWQNILKANPHARWGGAPGDPRWNDSATRRLGLPMLLPAVEPTFHISRQDQIFCMGSCFARHIEDAFLNLGFQVPSRLADIASKDILNKYSTHSMLNEFRWALEPETYPFSEESLIVETGGLTDPHLSFGGQVRSRAEVLALRRRVSQAVAEVRRCRLIILTLGLVEAWYDTEADVYFTEAPSYRACRRTPERYELRVLSYAENMEALEEIHQLLARHGHPVAKIVVTVSPVPLLATFGQEDVIVANTYSKATLRAVAGDFVHRHPDVDYLPSFESVMNSSRGIAWESDRVHVSETAVTANVLNFLAHYLDGDERAAMATQRDRLLASLGQGASAAAGGIVLPDFEIGDADAKAFPAGAPIEIQASSILSREFGPANLAMGPAVPWHAASPPRYPVQIEFTFARPYRFMALWLQAQDRYPDRGPTSFILFGEGDAGTLREVLRVEGAPWKEGNQWQSWPLNIDRPYDRYRLLILAGGQINLTLQRTWFQPMADSANA